MKIFDSSNPRVVASAISNVVTLTTNVQGTHDPLLLLSSNAARIACSVPKFGLLNQLNPSLTPNTIITTGVLVGDTVTVNTVVFTAVASGATGLQFNQGGGDAATAASLVSAINAYFKINAGAWFRTEDQTVAFGLTVYEPTGLVTVSATCAIEASFDGINAVAINGLTNPPFSNISGVGSKTAMTANVGGVAFVRANVTALSGTGAIVVVQLHGINSKSS